MNAIISQYFFPVLGFLKNVIVFNYLCCILHLEITCSDPGIPDHGSRDTETFKEGVVVTFTCDSGYTRIGPASITCEETGRWSGRRPQCERG